MLPTSLTPCSLESESSEPSPSQALAPDPNQHSLSSTRPSCSFSHFFLRWSVHSTTSPTTIDVSSTLPPMPIGVSARVPSGRRLHFLWQSATMRRAIFSSTAGAVGVNCPSCAGGIISLHMATSSGRNRLSNTPSLPSSTMSPSNMHMQWTALPFSITSMVILSSNPSYTRSSTRATCRGVCAWPSIRCISVWNTSSSGPIGPTFLLNNSISQSPTDITAIMGCSFPCILVLLSSTASRIVVDPRLSVFSNALRMSGIGPA
mmetsp:Transcript_6720/g.18354  ORF Transcript_6720/g.18354 Transcript_6720/m.18354 type:complete len:261 (-) Transcript_6720:430-1212(-)